MTEPLKKITLTSPREIKVLSEFIEGWRKTSAGNLIHVKNAPFNEILITNRPVGFFETETIFLCPLEIIPFGQMDKAKIRAYRSLKGMECELKYMRFLRRSPQFKSHRLLYDLKKVIPRLKINSELIDALNNNKNLMNLINEIKPDKINILLISTMPEAIATSISHDYSEGILKAMALFYKRPVTITWSLVVSKMVDKVFHYTKNIKGMFNILRLIVPTVLDVTKKYLELENLKDKKKKTKRE